VYIYRDDIQITARAPGSLVEFSLEENPGNLFNAYYPDMGAPPEPYHRIMAVFNQDLLTNTAYMVKVVMDNGLIVEGFYYTPFTFTRVRG